MPGVEMGGQRQGVARPDDRHRLSRRPDPDRQGVCARWHESTKHKVDAIVYIGDAMEENPDRLCHLAAEFGLRGTKAFLFQEGHDAQAERTFKEIVRLTGGAWFRLGPQSAAQLAELLGVIAVYATGGRPALEARDDTHSRLLIAAMGKG